MADEPATQGTDTEPTPQSDEPDFKSEAEKWKALSRKHEAEAKKNADAAKRLADLEEKDKTELQKLSDKAAESEQKAARAELVALRYEVAAEKGIPLTEAKRLIGSTREELEADADEYLAAHTSDADTKPPAGKPRTDLKPGNKSTDDPGPSDDPVLESITALLGISTDS